MSNLKRIREDKNITQKELSERSGVNIQMIAKYEQGVKDINKAQGTTLYKIASILNCRIEELLEDIPSILGEWEDIGDWLLVCSNCDETIENPDTGNTPKYCPNCGKPMKPYIIQ